MHAWSVVGSEGWDIRVLSRRVEDGERALFEEVVRMRRWLSKRGEGRREERRALKSAMVDVEGMGRQRVVGRPRPGKEVRRMLIVVAMVDQSPLMFD